jgi:hypothetical protein
VSTAANGIRNVGLTVRFMDHVRSYLFRINGSETKYSKESSVSYLVPSHEAEMLNNYNDISYSYCCVFTHSGRVAVFIKLVEKCTAVSIIRLFSEVL